MKTTTIILATIITAFSALAEVEDLSPFENPKVSVASRDSESRLANVVAMECVEKYGKIDKQDFKAIKKLSDEYFDPRVLSDRKSDSDVSIHELMDNFYDEVLRILAEEKHVLDWKIFRQERERIEAKWHPESQL